MNNRATEFQIPKTPYWTRLRGLQLQFYVAQNNAENSWRFLTGLFRADMKQFQISE